MGDIFYHSDVVVHYSLITLIQRAQSPDNGTFTAECLDSARRALIAHQKCSERFNVLGTEELWSGYVHWCVTTFLLLTCHRSCGLGVFQQPF